MVKAQPEKLEARWWKTWFDERYDWAGLARRRVYANRLDVRTLQDYWRRDPLTGVLRDDVAMRGAGELIMFDGREWHIAHLPPRDRSGQAESWKTDFVHPDWDRLRDIIAVRLRLAEETPAFFDGVDAEVLFEAYDGRALLDGVVLGIAFNLGREGAAAHVSCRQARFEMLDLERATLGPAADFTGALFASALHVEDGTFSGAASFAHALFLDGLDVSRTRFVEDVSFDLAVLLGEGRFRGCDFGGTLTFRGVTCWRDVSFDNAIFPGGSAFHGASFLASASFLKASFPGKVDFTEVRFAETATFSDAAFRDVVIFNRTRFDQGAFFHRASFSGDADFHHARFIDGAYFQSATFAGPARFHRVRFQDLSLIHI